VTTVAAARAAAGLQSLLLTAEGPKSPLQCRNVFFCAQTFLTLDFCRDDAMNQNRHVWIEKSFHQL
jgi:hypothetical protein